MFLFLVKTYLEELQKHSPEVHEACGKAMKTTTKDLDFIRLDKKAFELSLSISMDYAVMEKTNLASVVPLDAGWSDIGSWTALWEACEKDKEKNSIVGDVKAMSTENCLIRAENKLVATIGVKDLVVVETKDAVLVAHKDQVQKVRDLVEDLKSNGRHEHLNQREVFRPWGSYDSLETGERFQVKRITVKPGAKTSMQMHHHRAEHWIVVRGSAQGQYRRRDNTAGGEPVGLHYCGQAPSPGKPGEDPPRIDRGAVRKLPGRGRHRKVREQVWEEMIFLAGGS